jgi:hypothetical protein
MKIFLSSREEPFFANIKMRMGEAEESLRERRLLLDDSQKQSVVLMKGVQRKKTCVNDKMEMTVEQKDNGGMFERLKGKLWEVITGEEGKQRRRDEDTKLEDKVKHVTAIQNRYGKYSKQRHDCKFAPHSTKPISNVNMGKHVASTKSLVDGTQWSRLAIAVCEIHNTHTIYIFAGAHKEQDRRAVFNSSTIHQTFRTLQASTQSARRTV